jgi:hypothetical protein
MPKTMPRNEYLSACRQELAEVLNAPGYAEISSVTLAAYLRRRIIEVLEESRNDYNLR